MVEEHSTTEPLNYALRWNNHTTHIVQSFQELFDSEKHVDVTLVCRDGEIRAHRLVLSTGSPFFARILEEHKSCDHPIIFLKDFTKQAIHTVITFMYWGEVHVGSENMSTILEIAKTLGVQGLARAIAERQALRGGRFQRSLGSPEKAPSAAPGRDESSEMETSEEASPLQLTTREAGSGERELQQGSGSAGPAGPRFGERRKQANPRKCSGDDEPQDLSNARSTSEDLGMAQLNINGPQPAAEEAMEGDEEEPDEEDEEPEVEAEEEEEEEVEEEAENLSMRDSGRSRSSSRSANAPVKSEAEEPRSRGSTPYEREAEAALGLPLMHAGLNKARRSPYEYPMGRNARPGRASTSPVYPSVNSILDSMNSSLACGQWPGQPGGPAHHHSPLNQHLSQLQQQLHPLVLHPRHPSDAGLPVFPQAEAASLPAGPLPEALGYYPLWPGTQPAAGQAQTARPEAPPALHQEAAAAAAPPPPPPPPRTKSRSKKEKRERSSDMLMRRWASGAGGGPIRRPKGQHSAPRGGPPRTWTNDELCDALRHVWARKMTTSQASRMFCIPYNSLLMYVRGKYGKSLKLEQLKERCELFINNNNNNQLLQLDNNSLSSMKRSLSHGRLVSPPAIAVGAGGGLSGGAAAAPPLQPRPEQAAGLGHPPPPHAYAQHNTYLQDLANFSMHIMHRQHQQQHQQHQQQQQQQQQQHQQQQQQGLGCVEESRSRSRGGSRPRSNGHLSAAAARSSPAAYSEWPRSRPASADGAELPTNDAPLELSVARRSPSQAEQHQQQAQHQQHQLERQVNGLLD